MTDPAFIIWKCKYNYQCWFTEVLLSFIGKNKLNRSKSPIVCKKKKKNLGFKIFCMFSAPFAECYRNKSIVSGGYDQ